MMAKIIGVTHIFVYQVPKFNYFSILQKGKGVDHTSPPLPWNFASKTLDASNRLLIIKFFRVFSKYRLPGKLQFTIFH